ncbi:MAG TPA: hypothetical protein VKB80_03205 [Kofleriaceae bacterium]|nr:hypothetical protein [Kofleriaceae bacterium]
MDETEQAPRPSEESSSQEEAAAASGADEETESGFFNRALRGMRGWLGARDEDASRPAEEQPPPPSKETTPPAPEVAEPETYTVTAAELQRLVQSQKDRELAAERRRFALERAEQGDVGPIRQMAERGDGWARQQLAERGETWALGEIAQADYQRQAQAALDPIPHVAATLDQAMLHPILGALPLEEEQRIVGKGIVGPEGRQAAITESIKVIQREARHQGAEDAVTKALSDAPFVSRLLKSEAFRQALLKDKVASKQFRAYFRGELDEPDLNPAAGAGASRQAENEFMNNLLRGNNVRWRGEDES